jgi:hypothetical protein
MVVGQADREVSGVKFGREVELISREGQPVQGIRGKLTNPDDKIPVLSAQQVTSMVPPEIVLSREKLCKVLCLVFDTIGRESIDDIVIVFKNSVYGIHTGCSRGCVTTFARVVVWQQVAFRPSIAQQAQRFAMQFGCFRELEEFTGCFARGCLFAFGFHVTHPFR